MRELLAALGDNVKVQGSKWIAKCPVHGDKDFAMIISQRPDSSVGAHCFACDANGLDLYNALGLNLDELFGGKKLEKRDKPYLPNHLKDQFLIDKICIDINKVDIDAGKTISLADKRRVRLAIARIDGIKAKFTV